MKACVRGFNPTYEEDYPTIDQIRASDGYAILEFGAPWCGHCQASLPAIQKQLSARSIPHIKLFDGKGKVLGRQFQVKLWPTIILLNSGQEVARIVRPLLVDDVIPLMMNIKSD